MTASAASCMLYHAVSAGYLIAERQSVRQINDALGRFYSTLVYDLSVTLGKDRHIHTVTLGNIRIYACAQHWYMVYVLKEMETEETALERRRRLARERESATEYFRLKEKAFAAVCTSNH